MDAARLRNELLLSAHSILNGAPNALDVRPGAAAKILKPVPEYLFGIVQEYEPPRAGARHWCANCWRNICAPPPHPRMISGWFPGVGGFSGRPPA